MSTNSSIGIKNENDTVTSIYCHFDGYLSGVGQVLLDHYNTEELTKSLIGLGDLSSVQERLNPNEDEDHSFNKQIKGITVAYHRDRGEDFNQYKHDTERSFLKKPNIHYLWKDGKWFYGTHELTQELINNYK